MTHTNDIEEIPASPEDDSVAYLGTHSTEDLPAAIQVESFPRASTGVGSSHTKITFVPANNDENDDDILYKSHAGKEEAGFPRHRSPPPYGTDVEPESGPARGTGIMDPWSEQENNMETENLWNGGFSLLDDEDHTNLWWNASNRRALRLLGPGMLPVLATSKIHEESHTLVAVTVSVPDIPIAIPETVPSTSEESIEAQRSFKQPHSSDVYSAVPHPNAFYCAKCNGWIIIQGAQTMEMPIYSTYTDACPEINFPTPPRSDKKCNASFHYGTSDGEPNPLEAHHYHLYEEAIPSTRINPPFERHEWEQRPQLPKKACSQHENATDNFWRLPTYLMLEVEPDAVHPGLDTKADYLDLYSCCVCTQNVYVSRNVIPGVVSRRLMADLARERYGIDRSAIRVAIAFEFMVKLVLYSFITAYVR